MEVQTRQPRRNKFLEIYNLPKLNHEERKNQNRLITNNDTSSVIRKMQIKTTMRGLPWWRSG